MSANDEYVVVRKVHLDLLYSHCQHCSGFAEQRQTLPEELCCNTYSTAASEPCRKRKSSGTEVNRKERKTSPRWQDVRKSFLQKVPKPALWRRKQVEAGLSDAETYEDVVRALTGHGSIKSSAILHAETPHTSNALISLTFRMAALTKASLTNSNLQRSFSNFQALILLSICAVLEKRGVTYTVIDEIIQQITDAGEEDRKRFRRGAVWINGLIAQLVDKGWRLDRATELFFLSMCSTLDSLAALIFTLDALSLTYLGHIRHEENFRIILDELTTDDFTSHDFGGCLRPAYSIPGLIAYLVNFSDFESTSTRPAYGFPSTRSKKVGADHIKDSRYLRCSRVYICYRS